MSPVGGAVWGSYGEVGVGGAALLEEVHHWGRGAISELLQPRPRVQSVWCLTLKMFSLIFLLLWTLVTFATDSRGQPQAGASGAFACYLIG